jgi:hypothetical protein
MGIANSSVIKGAIDLLTELLNALNNITTGTGNLSTSFMKIFSAITLFKGGKAIFNSFFKSMVADFASAGVNSGKGFESGLTKTIGKLKMNFPLIGTWSKDLKILKKDIENFGQ